MNRESKIEWVATLECNGRIINAVYPSPIKLAFGLAEQTKQGWVVLGVRERPVNRKVRA